MAQHRWVSLTASLSQRSTHYLCSTHLHWEFFWMQLPFPTNKIRCNYRCTVSDATLHLGWYVCGRLEFQIWALFIALTHTCYFWRWCASRRDVWGSPITLLQGPLCLFWAQRSELHFWPPLEQLARHNSTEGGGSRCSERSVCDLTLHVGLLCAGLNEVQRLAWRELS